MRPRIWLTCIALLGVCLLLLLLRRSQSPDLAMATPGIGRSNELSKRVEAADVPRATNPYPLKMATAPPTATPIETPLSYSNRLWNQRLADWQAPIDFFGKVVDEHTNPVVGANITFSWSETPDWDGSGDQKTTTQSAAEGLFTLRDKRGPSLVVSVSKEGYYSSRSGHKGFSYRGGLYSPDPRNPVIFLLHKKGQGTELFTSEHGNRLKVNVRVPRDNTPVQVDLLGKRPSPTGQLEISQHKPPFREATEWSFRLSIPDGGFVENEDEFQFEAPVTEYLPTVEYRFTKGETNWTTQVSKQFYIAFGQPRRYGWLRIESNLGQETVFLTYAINPSGSRNLEPR